MAVNFSSFERRKKKLRKENCAKFSDFFFPVVDVVVVVILLRWNINRNPSRNIFLNSQDLIFFSVSHTYCTNES